MNTPRTIVRHAVAIVLGCCVTACGSGSQAAGPDAATMKRVLERQLQQLRPAGTQQRTVLFQSVTPGTSNGGRHAFKVTLTIHDYGAGYPANQYWGHTCVGTMENWAFDLVPDGAGDWVAQGRLTVTDNTCRDNPSAGVSAIPLDTLAGTALTAGDRRTPGSSSAPASSAAASLYVGEYACYGTGGRLMAGMGFVLKPGGGYVDLDGRRGGKYVHDAAAKTITFGGGFLEGQTGRNVRPQGFDLTRTVSCEPWR